MRLPCHKLHTCEAIIVGEWQINEALFLQKSPLADDVKQAWLAQGECFYATLTTPDPGNRPGEMLIYRGASSRLAVVDF